MGRSPRADDPAATPENRQRLWDQIARGELDEAACTAVRLLAVTSQPAVAAEIDAAIALMLQRVGRMAEAATRFRRAAECVEPGVEQASYLADAAGSILMAGEVDEAERLAREAIELGDREGNIFAACEGLSALSTVAHARGSPAAALELARRAHGLRTVQREATGGGPIPHLVVGTALIDLDRLHDADVAFTEGLALSRGAGATAQAGWFLAYRAIERFLAGRWNEALADAKGTLACAESSGTMAVRPLGWGIAGTIHACRGDRGALGDVLDAAGPNRLGAFGGYGEEWMLLARAIATRDPVEHCDRLCEAWHRARSLPWFLPWRVIAPELVRAAVAAKEQQIAESVTVAAAEGARLSGGVTSAAAAALRCEGLLRADPELLDAAVEVYRLAGRPFPLGNACLDGARAWSRVGSSDRALVLVREASEIFHGLGAVVWSAEAGQLLAALAEIPRSRPRTRDPLAGLTRSERTVAELASGGLTNPQIAARLTVSARTVQTHLSHVYAKLGITSRVELAALVAGGD
jgi:DNA-binding CsgD family transcriptional regulator